MEYPYDRYMIFAEGVKLAFGAFGQKPTEEFVTALWRGSESRQAERKAEDTQLNEPRYFAAFADGEIDKLGKPYERP